MLPLIKPIYKRQINALIYSLFILMLFSQNGTAAEKMAVFVSIVPQEEFVQQIGKDLVDVQVMVHPGADPHTYEPKPQQMVALSKAKIYFAVGIEFEKVHLDKIKAINPDLKVIHTDQGIEKLTMTRHHHHHENHVKDHHEHEKGEHPEEGGHDKGHAVHAGLDPHIWLSPPLVKVQARNICNALIEYDPEHQDRFEANLQEFLQQIDQLDTTLRKTLSDKKGMQFMVLHPSWGYFAHAYGLEQVPIEIEGKDPKPAQLKELIEYAKENDIKMVFVQPQFSAKSAELVAKEIGGKVTFADPMAKEWLANLKAVANQLREALK